MERDERIHGLLRQGHWFGALLSALQGLILERSSVRSFARGEFIIREGEMTKGLFAVLDGRVHLVRSVAESDETLVHVGESGFWFGDYGTFLAAPSVGSIIAASTVRVLLLPAAEFERIVADDPRQFRNFARMTIERYGLLMRYMGETHGLTAEDWLRTRLEDLAELRQRDLPTLRPVSIVISQAELASMVGVTRQTLSTLLARLQRRGVIEVGFRSIRILSPEAKQA